MALVNGLDGFSKHFADCPYHVESNGKYAGERTEAHCCYKYKCKDKCLRAAAGVQDGAGYPIGPLVRTGITRSHECQRKCHDCGEYRANRRHGERLASPF